MTEGQWTAYIQKYAIKSLLNLREEHRGSGWYHGDIRTVAKLGGTHYDVKISAIHEVDNGTLETILVLLRQASKPLVIHCLSGADRSGRIAALYLFAIEGQWAETAVQQLSLFYGHFPYLWSRSWSSLTSQIVFPGFPRGPKLRQHPWKKLFHIKHICHVRGV